VFVRVFAQVGVLETDSKMPVALAFPIGSPSPATRGMPLHRRAMVRVGRWQTRWLSKLIKNHGAMTATAEPTVTTSTQRLAGKYLTFTLQSESYGIDVLKVREIIRLTSITTVPQMPAHVCGVINLRGKIVPVMDLSLRLGFPESKRTEQSCIVVVHVKGAAGTITQMGLVVDGVEEVTNISAGDIEETPDFGAHISSDYILGMAKIKGVVKTLLDVDKVVSGSAF
jgi:purine-binding chemotaxis protein CheW